MNRRTSILALFSFLGGLSAAVCVSTAWFLTYLAGLGDWASLEGERELAAMLLAARIVAGVTVAPAVVALAFCLGARGAVRESGGALLGRGLYRAGALLAIGSVIFAFGGKYSVNARIDRMLADAKLEPRELLRRVMEHERAGGGEARAAKAHGRACAELEAAAEMDSSHSQQAVFDAVAAREELTEHEQMHLVDCVMECVDADYIRAGVIGKLAGNPWLTEETRAYILKRVSAMDSDTYRQQAILSLPQKPIESCGYLGVTHQADGAGAKITKVWRDSAAAKAGLEVGMTIVKFDGRPVRNQNELNALIVEHEPGAKVKLTLKDGREFEVTLGMRPGARRAEAHAEAQAPTAADALGAELRVLSADEVKQLGRKGGVRIWKIASGGPLDGKLKPGDILYTVDGKDVASVEEFLLELRRRPVGVEVEFGVSRAGGTFSLRTTLSKVREQE